MTVLIALLVICSDAAPCPEALARATALAQAFDMRGALQALRAVEGCDDAAGGAEFLEGLLGAKEAVEKGGTVESLRELRSAANALSRRAEEGGRRWEAASLAVRGLAAAAQQERGEMNVYFAEALRLETILLDATLPGPPFVSVHELAADTLLQVHQYADARAAYLKAGALIGYTPRVRLGLARTAERLDDAAGACGEYRALLDWWGSAPRGVTPPEIAVAQARVRSLACARIK